MATGQHTRKAYGSTKSYCDKPRTIPVIRRGQPADQVAYNQMVLALTRAPTITILTGAGISTSAGIPDFRSADGLYISGLPGLKPEALGSDLFNVRTLQNLQRLFAFGRAMGSLRKSCRDAKPTVCHDYIAKLHKFGRLARCYTQNIDGLQTRGRPELSEVVLELHGNIHRLQCNCCSQSPDGDSEDMDRDLVSLGYVYCTKCQERGTNNPSRRWKFRQLPPGLLLPNVLLNEESREIVFNGMTMDQLERKDGMSSLLLVIGTSIRTDGAAKLVKSLAKKVHHTGGVVVYIDRSPLLDSKWHGYIDVHIQAEIDDWARDSSICLNEIHSPTDNGMEVGELLRALLRPSVESALVGGSTYLGLSRVEPAGLGSIRPSPEGDSPTTPEPGQLVVLVCHSGAMPYLARALAAEIVETGRKYGWVCDGYVVVLSGLENHLGEVSIRENFQLIVVQLSDYLLRLRSPWRPIEPGQTIRELLEQSVCAIGQLAKQSCGQLLLTLCAEDELLDLDSISQMHGEFSKQFAFDKMVASLNMSHLSNRGWAKLAMDIISYCGSAQSDYVKQTTKQWLKNAELIQTSDLVIFLRRTRPTMILASTHNRPLGKPLPDISIACLCKTSLVEPTPKNWLVFHDATDGCLAKDVHVTAQCSVCKRTWNLETSRLVGVVRCVEDNLCVMMQYDSNQGWV